MDDQGRMSMDNNERALPRGLYDPIVTDQADDTQSDVAHRPQDNGAIIRDGFNAAEGCQTTQRGSVSGDAVAGSSTNREVPHQYRREDIAQGNRYSSSPAPSPNGEGSSYRAFVRESHATSAPSLYPGLFTVPTASGQQPAQRPTVHSNAFRAAPGFGPTSGGDRFESANVSRGTSEVPPGTGIFASVMTGDLEHPPWHDDESAGSADPRQEGQVAVNARDRSQCATPVDRHTADDANNTQYMGREPDPVAQRMEYWRSIARETLRAFDAGEADPIRVSDVRSAQEFWARHSRESGRQVLAAAERHLYGREFNANRGRALGDGAARGYAAQQASARAWQQAQLERERQYASEQVRIVREGQARQGTPRMDGRIFAHVMGQQDGAQGGARTAGASRQEPSLTGVQTETHRYGPFDGVFFYENPPVPFYGLGEPHPQTTHCRSSVPSPELPVHAGGREASRIREYPGCYEDDGCDRLLYGTQTRVAYHCQDQHRDHNDVHTSQDARYEQPVDRRAGDIAEWVDAQSAQMQASGVVQVERLSDSGSEALDEGNGETPSNHNGGEQSGEDGEGPGASGHGSHMYEYSEDWESVTFIGNDEPEDVEVDDDSLDGRWEDQGRSVERFL